MTKPVNLVLLLVGVSIAACSSVGPDDSADDLGAADQENVGAAASASTAIKSITWDFSTHKTFAIGSDLWPLTWAADDNIYGGWGDGGGFGGGDHVNRASIGFGKITGAPPSLVGTNLWGNATHDSTNTAPAQHQATFCGKPESIVSAAGALYAWVGSSYNDNASDNPRCAANPSTSEAHLAISKDHGASWTEPGLKFVENSGAFVWNHFVQFGKENAGAPGGYVYVNGWRPGYPNAYLARVLPANVATLSDWQVFTGVDSSGNAKWTSNYDTSHAAVLPTANGGAISDTFYHAQSGRFLSAGFGDTVGSLNVSEAPALWGPFTAIEKETNWGGFGSAESLAMMFPLKWISADGKTLWGVTSWGGGQPGDALHLIKATLSWGTTTTTGATELVSGVASKCLDDSGDLTTDKNKIQLYTCNGSAAQKWTYKNGNFVGPGGKCLDIQSDNQVKSTPVQLYTCNGGDAQKWTISGKQIKSSQGLCLDVRSSGDANGTQIQVYTCNGTAAQDWTQK